MNLYYKKCLVGFFIIISCLLIVYFIKFNNSHYTNIFNSICNNQGNLKKTLKYKKIGDKYFSDILFESMGGKFKLPNSEDWFGGQEKFDLFPNQKDPFKNSDRILSQMRHVPKKIAENKTAIKYKRILLYNGMNEIWDEMFFDQCPVSHCTITSDKKEASTADIIYWHTIITEPKHVRPRNQIWVTGNLLSPQYATNISNFFSKHVNNYINWTVHYRRDSTITLPYYKYFPYDLTKPEPKRYPLPIRNYKTGKFAYVTIFMSTCVSVSKRESIIPELKKYIKVHVYGKCNYLCQSIMCLGFIKMKYKFYLSFENSRCRDYITDTLFLNALQFNAIPIVMGAHPDDYKRVAPPHSYIHIEDFPTLKQLADYLYYLDKNDTAYNEYFAWKNYGKIIFFPFMWCRICMMAHEAENHVSVYKDVNKWFFGEAEDDICTTNSKWT